MTRRSGSTPAPWRSAELLRRVGHGDIAEMGALLAQAVPPVEASVMLPAGPGLTGRVVTRRWPAGGPPEELLGPSGQRPEPGADAAQLRTCQRCGKPCTLLVLGVAGRPGTAAVPVGRPRIVHGTGWHRETLLIDPAFPRCPTTAASLSVRRLRQWRWATIGRAVVSAVRAGVIATVRAGDPSCGV